MTIIEYLIIGEVAEWQRASGRGRTVVFDFGADTVGTLTVGGKESELEGGRCTMSLDGLSYGEYAPVLRTPAGTIEVEHLIIMGERILPADTSEKIHRLLLKRVRELEQLNKKNEERISELETLISGSALFEVE